MFVGGTRDVRDLGTSRKPGGAFERQSLVSFASSRFSEMLLDPIRGNAAAFVATWHILPAFLPFLYFFLSIEMQGEGTKTCINTPQILYCSLCTLLSTCTLLVLLSLIASNTVDRITLTFQIWKNLISYHNHLFLPMHFVFKRNASQILFSLLLNVTKKMLYKYFTYITI